jgi:nucleoid-associated protein YgaU
MSVKVKYQPVLQLGEQFNVRDGYVNEEGDLLKVGGTVQTQQEKDLMWDKIKEIGGENPQDIEADIKVEVTDYYGVYEVKSGDSLSKISKMYLGDAMRYMDIFNINREQLNNPDLIHPGQKLKIPFK